MDLQRIPRTILIIDDHQGLIALIQRCLSREGYHTAVAYSGQEALSWLSTQKADLLLLDLRLADMHGEELLLCLKARNQHIPFIVITGQGDERLAVNMMKQGARDYFIKDSSLTSLLPSMVTQTFEQLQQEQRLVEMEEALTTEQKRSAITLASIEEGVFTTDSHGRITYMNRMAEDLTGHSSIESLGCPIEDVVHFVDSCHTSDARHPVHQVLANGRPLHPIPHYMIRLATHQQRPVVFSASPIRGQGGRILGVVLILRDMTERLKLDQELLKASKLESLSLLAGGIAHDFNNLLTAILGNLSISRNWAHSRETLDEFLAEAEQASLRAKSLTQQLLTFAKGGSPLKKPLDIRRLVMETATFALRGSSTQCEFDVPEHVWAVQADEGQISQVIHNLALNAHQAMPEGGTVTIRCENTELSVERITALALSTPGAYLKIQFIDQGSGIPQAALPKIFDPYFSTKPQGTGLGLSTAYSVIKNHHGTIVVSSNTGEGTTFTLYLPAEAADTTPLDRSTSIIKGEGKILVMDDEPSIRSLVHQMLGFLGYEVHCVADGQEAIQQYEEALNSSKPFSAVILDLTVPGRMGGKETLSRLKQLDPGVRAIVASGYSNEMSLSQYSTYGFLGAVSKPFHFSDLSQLLSQITKETESSLPLRSTA